MTADTLVLASGILPTLQKLVMVTKLHPILVNFTAALVPVSVFSDAAGRYLKHTSLRDTAWWTLLFATVVTPLTAITGWLFWMKDDEGVTGMTIHKWLGSALALLLFGLFAWRLKLHRESKWATIAYLIVGAVFLAALIIQGHLGGTQTFSDM